MSGGTFGIGVNKICCAIGNTGGCCHQKQKAEKPVGARHGDSAKIKSVFLKAVSDGFERYFVTEKQYVKRKGKGKGMENVKFQVLGYKNLKRKSDGKDMTVVNTMSVCTAEDNAKGVFGHRITDFWLPDSKVGSLTMDCIGQEFVPEYGINGFGKPTLTDFKIEKWK